MPGYYHAVPQGQSHSPIEGLRIELALMGSTLGNSPNKRCAQKWRWNVSTSMLAIFVGRIKGNRQEQERARPDVLIVSRNVQLIERILKHH